MAQLVNTKTQPRYWPSKPDRFDPAAAGTITSGTPAARVFRLLYPWASYHYRHVIVVDNTRGSQTLKITFDSGDIRYLEPGAIQTITSSQVGLIRWYTVDCTTGTITSNTVNILEAGGISEP